MAVKLLTLEGATVDLSDADLAPFAAGLDGRLVTPADAGYDDARRVWNGTVDRRPGLIVRCRTTADVARTVRLAADRELRLSVRGGGHNVAGHASVDRGLVVDLSEMRAVAVDPARRVAVVEGGARWGDVDAATQVHGLATPGGVVSTTGVAGLTLGGGLGWLTRRHGLSCDNLLAAEVVTADGRVVMADPDQNTDLLWALQGGGGNFGVVTRFFFRLHPVGPEVTFLFRAWPEARAAEVIALAASWVPQTSDDLGGVLAVLMSLPVEAPIPEPLRGQRVAVLVGCHAGPRDAAERELRALDRLGPPLIDLGGPRAFTEVQRFLDADYPVGRRYYWKSIFLRQVGPPEIAALVDLGRTRPSPLTTVDVGFTGTGAMGRVPADATAFGRRDAACLIAIESNWDDPAADPVNVAWTRSGWERLAELSGAGMYVNFPGSADESEAMVRHAYRESWDRLRTLKRRWDPKNLFRGNVNIRP